MDANRWTPINECIDSTIHYLKDNNERQSDEYDENIFSYSAVLIEIVFICIFLFWYNHMYLLVIMQIHRVCLRDQTSVYDALVVFYLSRAELYSIATSKDHVFLMNNDTDLTMLPKVVAWRAYGGTWDT